MKQNQIFMIIGIIALILIIANWNKIFKPNEMRKGGEVGGSSAKQIVCDCGDEGLTAWGQPQESVCYGSIFRGCRWCCGMGKNTRTTEGSRTIKVKASASA